MIGIDIVLVIDGDIVLIDFIATPLRTRVIAKHGMRAAISPQVITTKVIAATIQATPAHATEATAAKIPRAGAGLIEKSGRQERDRKGRNEGAKGGACGALDHDDVSLNELG